MYDLVPRAGKQRGSKVALCPINLPFVASRGRAAF